MNIIVLVLDTLRYDHLSCYGYHRQTTPFIDSLAREGVVFEQCTATSPWTLPSHVSLFTGTYCSRHRVSFSNITVPPSLKTLAGWLAQHGYQTLGLSSNTWLRPETGLTRGFDDFYLVNEASVHQRTKLQKALFYLKKKWRSLFADKGAARTGKMVHDWLRRRYDRKRPLFLFINYLEPHLPYRPPRAYRRLYARPPARQVNQDAWAYFAGEVSMTAADFQALAGLYDAEIRYTDDQLRKLWRTLQEAGVLDEAMVVITADHGENIGDHDLMDHQYSLHDTLLHVPCIFWSSAARHPLSPARIKHPVQLCDILPTLAQLLRIDDPTLATQVQGVSFLPYLQAGNAATAVRHWSAAEYLEPNLYIFQRRFPAFDYSDFDVRFRTIAFEGYKYIHDDSGREWLYYLPQDTAELYDLSRQKSGRCRQARALLEQALGVEDFPEAQEMAPPDFDDPAVKARLRALGYL